MASFTGYSIEPCNRENITTILDGLNDYNLTRVAASAPTWTPLEYVAKDTNGTEIGGILGGIGYWSGLEIKALWVEESHRKKGIGTQILKHVERIAMEKGAELSMLDTFDFQAEQFYLKNGYLPVGEIKNFPKGHRKIYFAKRLT